MACVRRLELAFRGQDLPQVRMPDREIAEPPRVRGIEVDQAPPDHESPLDARVRLVESTPDTVDHAQLRVVDRHVAQPCGVGGVPRREPLHDLERGRVAVSGLALPPLLPVHVPQVPVGRGHIARRLGVRRILIGEALRDLQCRGVARARGLDPFPVEVKGAEVAVDRRDIAQPQRVGRVSSQEALHDLEGLGEAGLGLLEASFGIQDLPHRLMACGDGPHEPIVVRQPGRQLLADRECRCIAGPRVLQPPLDAADVAKQLVADRDVLLPLEVRGVLSAQTHHDVECALARGGGGWEVPHTQLDVSEVGQDPPPRSEDRGRDVIRGQALVVRLCDFALVQARAPAASRIRICCSGSPT